jgi:hypothetical protein
MRIEAGDQWIQLAYCVYEHWRPDTQTCFYVGKGKLRRAKTFEARNDRYRKIVAKLKRLGLKPEIRIVAFGLSDPEAIAAEIARISLRRSEGVDLANYTDGGDGTSGRRHSAETRSKMAAKATGRVLSEETIGKMVASRTGLKKSAETRAKQSASAKVAQRARFEKMKQTKEGRAAFRLRMVRISRKGRHTPEYREQKRQAALVGWAKRRSS